VKSIKMIKNSLFGSLFVFSLLVSFACPAMVIDIQIMAQKTNELFKICQGKIDDAKKVEQLINEGAYVNAKDNNGWTSVYNGWTPLCLAAMNGLI
jgi:hypothetical protein